MSNSYSQLSKILVCYSNPRDSQRLRLDKEHKIIEQLLKKHGLESSVVKRIHATTVEDLVHTIRQDTYKVIQLSCHGSPDGFYLESANSDNGFILRAAHLNVLLRENSSHLQVLICICCFSSESIPTLIQAAPYLITIFNEINDDGAIKFVENFYDLYFSGATIQESFQNALFLLREHGREVNVLMSRRATYEKQGRVLFEVFPNSHRGRNIESLCVDITAVEKELYRLSISKEKFLSILTRKIRIHQWIFDYPREKALLQLGEYFGIFSWQSANDVIFCEKLLTIKSEIDEKLIKIWASLIMSYNDSYVQFYRLPKRPADLSKKEMFDLAIRNYNSLYQYIFEYEKITPDLQDAIPIYFKMSKALFAANLKLGEEKFKQEDYKALVVYLEGMLSSMHDIIDALTDKISTQYDE